MTLVSAIYITLEFYPADWRAISSLVSEGAEPLLLRV